MRLITILMALCLIWKSQQMLEFYEENATLVNQLVCVNTALKSYVTYHRNIWIFSRNLISPVKSLRKVPATVFTEWDMLRERLFVDRRAMIIFLEGNASQDINGLERLQGIVMVGPVLIVCITDMVCSSEIYMNKIIETVVSADMHYVAIDERGIIDIYKYTTTTEGSCGMARFLRRGHCSDKSTAKNGFQTLVNFQKCPMRVVTWPRPMYLDTCNGDNSTDLCGIEGSVVQVVAKKINATLVLLRARNPDAVRCLVAKRDVDLGYGGLDTRPFQGVSYSIPYMYVQATFIATHSTWTIERSFSNIFQPLGTEVWMGIGVTIVSVLVLQRLVPYFRRIYTLQLFGIFIGIPLSRQPGGLPIRIYFFSLVLFGYLCSQSYLANLTKVLSAPKQEMIRTLRDLEKSKLRVTGPTAIAENFKDEYPRIYHDFQGEDFSEYYDNLVELLRKGRSNSAYYVEELDRRITEWKTVEALHDRFNWYSVAFVAPNTSAILRITDKVFSRLDQGGILRMSGDSILTSSGSVEDDELSSSKRSVVLDFGKLKCIFILHFIGLGLSFLVFLIEIITSFMKRKTELKSADEVHPEWSRQRRGHGIVTVPDGDVTTE